MPEVYCGIDKLPKNKRFGTMAECKEMNQVKRYGMIRVDKRIIEKPSENSIGETRNNIIIKGVKTKAKIRRLKRELENKELDKEKKKQKKVELEKEQKLLKAVINKLKKVEEKKKKEKAVIKKKATEKKTIKKTVEKKPKKKQNQKTL